MFPANANVQFLSVFILVFFSSLMTLKVIRKAGCLDWHPAIKFRKMNVMNLPRFTVVVTTTALTITAAETALTSGLCFSNL
jgi:hypothetical protein